MTCTVAGTVAKLVLSIDVLKFNPPAGAGDDRFSVTFEVCPLMTVSDVGEMLNVSVTVTVCESGAKPAAVAVMAAVPIATPCTTGFDAGIWSPCGMNTLGVTVAIEMSLLDRVTVTPPDGAGMPMLSAMPALLPGATTSPVPSVMRLLVVAVSGSVIGSKPTAVAEMCTIQPRLQTQ